MSGGARRLDDAGGVRKRILGRGGLEGQGGGHYQGAYGAGSDTDGGGGREPQYSTEARCRLAVVIGEQQGRSLKTKGGFT